MGFEGRNDDILLLVVLVYFYLPNFFDGYIRRVEASRWSGTMTAGFLIRLRLKSCKKKEEFSVTRRASEGLAGPGKLRIPC